MTFQGRTIDLQPHLEGFPYANITPDFESGVVYFDHKGDQRTLMKVPLSADAPIDFAAGTRVTDVDWDSRSRWGVRQHPNGHVYFWGDERNDERMNLFRIAPEGTVAALTDEPYLYGWSWNDARDSIVILPRRGEQGSYTSCVELMDLEGGKRLKVLCDTPELQLSWTDEPSWAPDARGVLLEVNKDGRRDRSNLAWVPFDDPKLHVITDPSRARTSSWAIRPWLDNDRFVYIDDQSGFGQIHVYDLSKGENKVLTAFTEELTDVALLAPGGKPVLVAVLHRPDADTLLTLDPQTGNELARTPVDGSIRFGGDAPEDGMLAGFVTSTRTPFSMVTVQVTGDGALTVAPWTGLPAELQQRIVQCDVEKVSIPTFDIDPKTGKTRELHGFLYTPKQPADPPIARVLSFYGGSNTFASDIQVFCEAGIATLSPAVRGSWGFGTEFYTLNDGDLGGDEIIDVFEAARWLESEKGYARGRIGTYGRSHGGYATMRAMTFPPGTNGHDADKIYPFAFGLADAGFSDIIDFYENCNIPDWVVLEAGDPATEADKLKDRSPLTHVDKLAAPILLMHGENDNRVPVAGSRQFAEACAAAGKQCTYVEYPGQGHRVKGLANQRAEYQARFDFLESIF